MDLTKLIGRNVRLWFSTSQYIETDIVGVSGNYLEINKSNVKVFTVDGSGTHEGASQYNNIYISNSFAYESIARIYNKQYYGVSIPNEFISINSGTGNIFCSFDYELEILWTPNRNLENLTLYPYTISDFVWGWNIQSESNVTSPSTPICAAGSIPNPLIGSYSGSLESSYVFGFWFGIYTMSIGWKSINHPSWYTFVHRITLSNIKYTNCRGEDIVSGTACIPHHICPYSIKVLP